MAALRRAFFDLGFASQRAIVATPARSTVTGLRYASDDDNNDDNDANTPPPPTSTSGLGLDLDSDSDLESKSKSKSKLTGDGPKGSGPFSEIASLIRSSSSSSATPLPPARPTYTPSGRPEMAPLSLTDLLDTSTPAEKDDYHLHVYAHKHNTHITFTNPDKTPIVSLSAGNLGFRKSHRGTYDAAYQLATTVFKSIEDKNIHPRSVEVVLRGFGQGREAVTGALLGQEGRYLKDSIRRVTDSTRLKFGGTRSKKPRRLG